MCVDGSLLSCAVRISDLGEMESGSTGAHIEWLFMLARAGVWTVCMKTRLVFVSSGVARL